MPWDITRQFSQTVLDLIKLNNNQIAFMPINLGGTSIGSGSGGAGVPPGGFSGQLAQKYVCYDTTEGMASGSVGGSGSIPSLVDNLNRIRLWQAAARWFEPAVSGGNITVRPGIWWTSGSAFLDYAGGGIANSDGKLYLDTSGNLNIDADWPSGIFNPVAVISGGAIQTDVRKFFNEGGSGESWSLIGNAGTVAGTNFLGTTDDVDVVFKRNNLEVARLAESGTDPIFIVGEPSTGVDAASLSGATLVTVGDGHAASVGNVVYAAGNRPACAGYRAKGTLAIPLAVAAGDGLLRLGGRGYKGAAWPGGSGAVIDFVAAEAGAAGEGTRIEFGCTPLGLTYAARAVVASVDYAVGIKNVVTNLYTTKDYTLTIPASGSAALGVGVVNTLAEWTDAHTLTSLPVVPIANGGTNAITANLALNNLLPSQAGQSGNVLGTDGANTGWVVGSSGSSGTIIIASLPCGSIIDWSAESLPQGWLECDGAEVSRTTYADLYAVVGDTFGAGDDSTTFNLPNIKSRVIVGRGQGAGLTNRILAATGGEETHILTDAEMPSHSHDFPVFGDTPGPLHTISDQIDATWGDWFTSVEGSDAAHENMPPFIVLVKIIKYTNATASDVIFNDDADPENVSLTAANTGDDIYAARRDHIHRLEWGNTILTYHANGDPVSEFSATEAGLVAALAAAGAGDTIGLHQNIAITLTSELTITQSIMIRGLVSDVVNSRPLIEGLITVNGGAVVFESIRLQNTTTDSTYGVGTRYALRLVSGSINLRETIVYVSGGTVWNLAVLADGATATYIDAIDCEWTAASAGAGNVSAAYHLGASTVAAFVSRLYLTRLRCNSDVVANGAVNCTTGNVSLFDCIFSNENAAGSHLRRASGTLTVYGCSAQTSASNPVMTVMRTSGTITNAQGDRAAYSVEDYHATDIEAAALTRHLPAPGVANNTVYDNGANWVTGKLPIVGLADGTLAGQFITTGANPYPAGWSTFALAGTALETYTFSATGGTVPTGTGTSGRVAQWGAGNTLTTANIIGPAANILTLAATVAATLTVPATGTAALGTGSAAGVAYWTGTNTIAHSAGATLDNTGNLGLNGNITLDTATWIGLGAAEGRLVFTNAATDTAVFSACNVGIGVVPANVLHILGPASTYLTIGSSGANNLDRGISFNNQAGTVAGYITLVPNTVGTNSVMNFYVGGGAAGDKKMLVLDNGNVSIGPETAPPSNLYVSVGSATLTQNILTVHGGGVGGAFGFSVQANNGDVIFQTNHLTYNSSFPNGGVTVAGAFGCNGAAAQAAYASGGAVVPGAGAFGFDSAAHAAALATLVTNIRAALVANGIMS
jgi:microcystin-dependent protein